MSSNQLYKTSSGGMNTQAASSTKSFKPSTSSKTGFSNKKSKKGTSPSPDRPVKTEYQEINDNAIIVFYSCSSSIMFESAIKEKSIKIQRRNMERVRSNSKRLLKFIGSYQYSNNYFKYEGDWNQGFKHGEGRLMLGDGSYYEVHT